MQFNGAVRSPSHGVKRKALRANVDCARPETPIADLVHQMTDKSQPHVPVVDDQNRVVGIVTQSDALAALYRRVALSAS